MKNPVERPGLFYPFHLCHERTLQQLLTRYASVHFRDYMALQLTPMSGTTAYRDRMGDPHPELVATGRIVQGYSVSGPLDATMALAVDRDLSDKSWRTVFHTSLSEDRRFQRGLFDFSHAIRCGDRVVPGPAFILHLITEHRHTRPYTVRAVQEMSVRPLTTEEGLDFEYALALVKTSASLVYTIHLANRHGLEAVTDSASHFRLLQQTSTRESKALENYLIDRTGY